MKIALSAGHYPSKPGKVTSRHVEHIEAKKIINKVLQSPFIKGARRLQIVKVPSRNLARKIAFVNPKGFDVAIEIHFNSNVGRAGQGIEVLCYNQRRKNQAQALLSALLEYLPFKSRGIKYWGDIKKDRGIDLAWLSRTRPPSFIIEVCFLNNLKESRYLDMYRPHQIIANAIIKGIINLLF